MVPNGAPRKAMNSGELWPESGGAGGGAIAPRGDKVVTESAAAPDAAAAPKSTEELSTLSTPPTVRTTVETDDTTRILEPRNLGAREEVLGGSGGEEEKPDAATGAIDAAWARAESARAYCKLGRCAYANLERRGPDRYLAAIGCDGYHASRTAEPDGRVTVRWGLCPRQREWWRLERIRRAAERPVEKPRERR